MCTLGAIATGAQAQITFTTADLQQAGKTYVTKTDTTTIVDVGNASASAQNWDFSALTMHYMSGPTFDLTSETPYAADFPNSNLYTYGPAIMFGGFFGAAPVSAQGMDNGYMFWEKNGSGFWTDGFMADEGPYAGKQVHFFPQELILGTPATLGSDYPNLSKWALYYDENAADVDTVYEVTTEKSQLCDAWGSLTTPTGTYPDVLRIYEHGVKIDSVKSYMNGNPLLFLEFSRDTFNNYIFVTNGIHYPLAIVKADVDFNVKSVEYYFMEGFSGVSTLNANQVVNIYPNPADAYFTVTLVDQHDVNTLTLYDMVGSEAATYRIEGNQQHIDCSTLTPGIYYYAVTGPTSHYVGRVVIH